MNQYDAARKIAQEIGCDMTLALRMSEQLEKVHKDLHPVISSWFKGDHIGFDFCGVSLEMIMEKENSKYIQAIFSMNALLNNPQFASMYQGFQFASEDLEE